MDLDVADMSLGSVLRRAGDAASPLSAPSSSSPTRHRLSGRRRRRSSAVRAALLRRAAGRRRPPADNTLQQFVRDQQVAFDKSADSSVGLDESGSPTARARSFLTQQRRSLSGEELAQLLRELREPPARDNRRRLSVGVSQRQLAALGDDGVQALMYLVDGGLEEFDGTLSASVDENTLTSSGDGSTLDASARATGTPDGEEDSGEESELRYDPGEEDENMRDKDDDNIEELGAGVEDMAIGEEARKEGLYADVKGASKEITLLDQDLSDEDVDALERTMEPTVPYESRERNVGVSLRNTPVRGTRTRGTPGRDTSTRGTPARGTPARGTPARGTPARDTPARGTPARGTPARGTPARGTPARGTPTHSPPGLGAPVPVTPSVGSPLHSARPLSARRRSSSGTSGSRLSARRGLSPAEAAAAADPIDGGSPAADPVDGGSPAARDRPHQLRTPRSLRRPSSAASPPASEEAQSDEVEGGADDAPYNAYTVSDSTVTMPGVEPSVSVTAGRARSSPSTPRPKATPRGDASRRGHSLFDRLAGLGRARTSTPMSEPPRRTAGGARPSPHSKSLYVAASSPRAGRSRRLTLALDEDGPPVPTHFTSGLIDDPDEPVPDASDGRGSPDSDVSEAYPTEAEVDPADTPRLLSAGSGGGSTLPAGARDAGTPFVPSAESTRLSLRPHGAPGPSSPPAGERSSRSPAGMPTRRRSLREGLADRTRPGRQPAPTKDAASPRAAGRKLSAQQAFARLFPNYEHDQQERRETKAAAAAARRRAARQPAKRSSLFAGHGTRRWFKKAAVGLRVTTEALREVDASVEKFERMVRGWLREVTGPRSTPSHKDALAVLRRSGVAGTEPELRRLIRRYLMMEDQRELIRITESDGRVYPDVNPLEEF